MHYLCLGFTARVQRSYSVGPRRSKLDQLLDEIRDGRNYTTVTGYKINSFSPDNNSSAERMGWRNINWTAVEESDVCSSAPSKTDRIMVRDRLVFLKRDDLLKLHGSQISGNKARKFLTLNSMSAFPSCIVSYGGPQSNAMVALAAMVHSRNVAAATESDEVAASNNDPRRKRFVYYTKKLPRFLRNQPSGNLFRALSLGMELIEVSPEDYNMLFGGDFGGKTEPPLCLPPPVHNDSLWIPQGGACGVAQAGARLLAREILEYWLEVGNGRPLSVFLPGGTCSTALFLHEYLQELQMNTAREQRIDIKVVVIPCVGDAGYARRQMLSLSSTLGLKHNIPDILPPSPDDAYFGQGNKGNDYFPFGEPALPILRVFEEMQSQNQITLDLLYGAPSWALLLRHWHSQVVRGSSLSPKAPNGRREIMYVHSGGLEGM